MNKFLLFVASILFCYKANCQKINQSLISTSQNTVITDQFSYSWSIGETIINSNDLTLSAGYHSEATISIAPVTSNKDKKDSFLVTYFPNPTNRYLNINMSHLPKSTYSITVHDLKGTKILITINNSENIKTIDFNQLKTGMYYLDIIEETTKNTIKQFKVIKK